MAPDVDEREFSELVAPHVRELRVHCYRMLGSLTDADDLLQETLTAAWRGIAGFVGRSSLRTWLYRIATNRCLNAIRDGRRHPPPEPTPSSFAPPEPTRRGDVTWLQPYPDAGLDPAALHQSRESIELAFVAALQRMPPRQTAALVLCDVLGFAVAEVAAMLDTTPTAVKGALQRARAGVRNDPRPTDPDASERELARRFAEAFGADDVDGVVALLSDDAWLAMPPAPHEYHGPAAIGEFLRASACGRGRPFRLCPTSANGQPAFACYLPGPDGARPTGVVVLSTTGGRITRIDRFLDDRLPRLFGLPALL